jgi:putative hydrolase of the HAD superfamily
MVIFFDIDETLVNQRQAEAAAARRFLEAYGKLLSRPYTVVEFCRHWRELREKHVRAFFSGDVSFTQQRHRRLRELFAGAALSSSEIDRRLAVYQEAYRSAWRLFADVRECLDALAHLELGIVSNGSAEQQWRKLRLTGIADQFSTVVISEDVGAAKPDSRIFAAACERAGRAPQHCVYVGDRLEDDALASRSAGLRGIWLSRRAAPPVSGVETIASLSELPARLGIRSAAPKAFDAERHIA